MSDKSDIYTRLGLNAERFVGYLYSGLCICVVVCFVFPKEINTYINSLGGFLSTLAVIAIGFAAFVLYRYLIGEYLLFPLQHAVHNFRDVVLKKNGEKVTSSMKYLKTLGVQRGMYRDAYTAIREAFFSEKTKMRLDIVHGELHALYISSINSYLILIISYFRTVAIDKLTWILVGTFTLLAAIIADTYQHTIETRMMKSIDKLKLIDFLRHEGHVEH